MNSLEKEISSQKSTAHPFYEQRVFCSWWYTKLESILKQSLDTEEYKDMNYIFHINISCPIFSNKAFDALLHYGQTILILCSL